MPRTVMVSVLARCLLPASLLLLLLAAQAENSAALSNALNDGTPRGLAFPKGTGRRWTVGHKKEIASALRGRQEESRNGISRPKTKSSFFAGLNQRLLRPLRLFISLPFKLVRSFASVVLPRGVRSRPAGYLRLNGSDEVTLDSNLDKVVAPKETAASTDRVTHKNARKILSPQIAAATEARGLTLNAPSIVIPEQLPRRTAPLPPSHALFAMLVGMAAAIWHVISRRRERQREMTQKESVKSARAIQSKGEIGLRNMRSVCSYEKSPDTISQNDCRSEGEVVEEGMSQFNLSLAMAREKAKARSRSTQHQDKEEGVVQKNDPTPDVGDQESVLDTEEVDKTAFDNQVRQTIVSSEELQMMKKAEEEAKLRFHLSLAVSRDKSSYILEAKEDDSSVPGEVPLTHEEKQEMSGMQNERADVCNEKTEEDDMEDFENHMRESIKKFDEMVNDFSDIFL